MEQQKRLRILPVPSLKEVFHGATGTLLSATETIPPSGKSWKMFLVALDKPVNTHGVDGHIEHKTVCLPETCFEEEYGTQHITSTT